MRFKLDRSSRYGNDPINCNKAIPVGKAPDCDWESQEYEIEINALDELIEFIGEVGTLIVTKDSIEIYDDYRE